LAQKIQSNPDAHIVDKHPQNGEEAWEELKKGNKCFVEGNLSSYLQHIAQEVTPDVRKELSTGQHPYATILTCSDSRVCPELIFDEGLGEIFTVRVAGNVVDKVTLGSLEYSIEHLGTPLLVLMGHQNCGAVTAALNAKDDSAYTGNIGDILTRIKSSAEQAKKEVDINAEKDKCLDRAIQLNVHNAKVDVLAQSTIIKEHVEKGTLKIICLEYYLTTGEALIIDQ